MKKEIKTFIVSGKKFQFNSTVFNDLFDVTRKKREMNVLEYETEIGDALGLSSNAIHNWRFNLNGPSDLETIKKLASYLSITDYMLLLKIREEEFSMQISERQKDSLKRIYDAVIEYLDLFKRTDGFNDYWYTLSDKGVKSNQIEDMLYEIAERELHKVELVVAKEYIELHKHPVYNLLQEYVWDDLCETYTGKLSYAYRFEAPVENVDGTRSGVSTEEEYIYSLNKINEILENYM